MKIQGNLIIFRMEEAERKDVRRLPEKKLQLLLDENNQFPAFPIDNQTPIKQLAEEKMEQIFQTSQFYIEQLYTWGEPAYYTKTRELTVSYLGIIHQKKTSKMPANYSFLDIQITNEKQASTQQVKLQNAQKEICYTMDTEIKRERENIEYCHHVVGKAEIDELTAKVIHTGIKRLRNRIENTNIAFSFLDKEFSLSELQQVYEVILDKKLIPANFRKKIAPMVKKTKKVVKESAYRPAVQYTLNEKFIRNWV